MVKFTVGGMDTEFVGVLDTGTGSTLNILSRHELRFFGDMDCSTGE